MAITYFLSREMISLSDLEWCQYLVGQKVSDLGANRYGPKKLLLVLGNHQELKLLGGIWTEFHPTNLRRYPWSEMIVNYFQCLV